MRVRILVLLCIAGGCGDDNKASADAARAIDAPTDAPFFKQYVANEGGEVRLEYINFVNGMASIRVTAYNYKTAGTYPFFGMPNYQGECWNDDSPPNAATQTNRWPFAQNPEATRIYEDPGFLNGGVVISGGPTPFVAKVNTADGFDGLHRAHPANHYSFYYGGATANDASTYAAAGAPYTVTFPGSTASIDPGGAGIPAQTFTDVLWMPQAFTLTTPPAGSVAIKADTDMTFSWTMPPLTNPADHEVYALIGFTGAMGPSTICVYPVASAGGTGSITVPAAYINDVIAKYPTGGTLGRQTLTHVVKELVDADGPTGNRVDFLSIWCYSGPFTVQ